MVWLYIFGGRAGLTITYLNRFNTRNIPMSSMHLEAAERTQRLSSKSMHMSDQVYLDFENQ